MLHIDRDLLDAAADAARDAVLAFESGTVDMPSGPPGPQQRPPGSDTCTVCSPRVTSTRVAGDRRIRYRVCRTCGARLEKQIVPLEYAPPQQSRVGAIRSKAQS